MHFVLVIFKSLSWLVAFIDVDFEYILSGMDPWSVLKKIFMAYLIHEMFVSAIEGDRSVVFIQIGVQGLAVGSPTLGGMSRAIFVVGDIHKPAPEAIHFSLRCVLIHFILPGNLPNAQLVE